MNIRTSDKWKMTILTVSDPSEARKWPFWRFQTPQKTWKWPFWQFQTPRKRENDRFDGFRPLGSVKMTILAVSDPSEARKWPFWRFRTPRKRENDHFHLTQHLRCSVFRLLQFSHKSVHFGLIPHREDIFPMERSTLSQFLFSYSAAKIADSYK